MANLEEFVEICETWQIRRVQDRVFTRRDMHEFVAVMNAMTRRLVSVTRNESPEFWSAVAELATNAQTLTTKGAKIIADGVNRTDA